MQLLCQWIHLVFFVWAVIDSVHKNYNGRPAREPQGFVGLLCVVAIVATFALIHWQAGTWSIIGQ